MPKPLHTDAITEDQTYDEHETERFELSTEERKQRVRDINGIVKAREMRERQHPEFDYMTYSEYYDENRRKALALRRSKKNQGEVEVATGVTREKTSALLSAIIDLDLEHDIRAFDENDDMEEELGNEFTDMVSKSREIEQYRDRRSLIYRTMLDQGDVFLEEVWRIEEIPEPAQEYRKWNPRTQKIADFNRDVRKDKKQAFAFASLRKIPGKRVYLGNIRIEDIRNQPFIAIYDTLDWDEAEALFGSFERWKYVPKAHDCVTSEIEGDSVTFTNWNLEQLEDNKVGVVKMYRRRKNLFQVYVNGIPMYPHNYPLTAIAPEGEYKIIQGKADPIDNFAYSRSVPAKTQTDEDLLDETYVMIVERMRRGWKPPMGTTRAQFDPNVLKAGTVTHGVKEGEFFPLLPDQNGVTQADFSVFELIKSIINEKTVSPTFSGDAVKGSQTATEIMELKERSMLKLGVLLDGVINLEKQMVLARIHTILDRWTRAEGEEVDQVKQNVREVFRTVNYETTLEDGRKGMKMFKFTNEEYPDEGDHEQLEEDMETLGGKPVRITYLNVDTLRQFRWKWYVSIIATPKSNDKLSQIMFVQNVQEGLSLFGVESFNMDYLKRRWANKINEDYSRIFKEQNPLMDALGGMMNGQGNSDALPQMSPNKQPTLSLSAN